MKLKDANLTLENMEYQINFEIFDLVNTVFNKKVDGTLNLNTNKSHNTEIDSETVWVYLQRPVFSTLYHAHYIVMRDEIIS